MAAWNELFLNREFINIAPQAEVYKFILNLQNIFGIKEIKKADMTNDPWPAEQFHGIICWDALHHNTIKNIRNAINIIYDRLCSGGQFLCTLISDKSGTHARKKEIEKNTFIDSEEA